MSLYDEFQDLYVASSGASVTPSDATEFQNPKTLFVGTGGNIAVTMWDDDSAVTLLNVANGTFLDSIAVKKVMSTNTTASNIVAFGTKK